MPAILGPATTDPPTTPLVAKRNSQTRVVDASQFYGAHFVTNLEAAVLEVGSRSPSDLLMSKTFSGQRNQQWLIHAAPYGSQRVALASLEDGRYLARNKDDGRTVMDKTPFYWDLWEVAVNTYRLHIFDDYMELSMPGSFQECASAAADDVLSSELLHIAILEDSEEVRRALSTGSIGPYVFPDKVFYHTIGSRGPFTILIRNDLDELIYASVTGTSAADLTHQYPIKPRTTQFWVRSGDEEAHISLAGSIGAQSAGVYPAYIGKVLHIQNLAPSRPAVWRGTSIIHFASARSFSDTGRPTGIQSVLVDDATYTPNVPARNGSIGIKNELDFDIHVSVFSTVQGGNTGQYIIRPDRVTFWSRDHPEVVFVSVGSSPGLPRAFLGRPGYTLSVNTLPS